MRNAIIFPIQFFFLPEASVIRDRSPMGRRRGGYPSSKGVLSQPSGARAFVPSIQLLKRFVSDEYIVRIGLELQRENIT
jgi:hypothetical protein